MGNFLQAAQCITRLGLQEHFDLKEVCDIQDTCTVACAIFHSVVDNIFIDSTRV